MPDSEWTDGRSRPLIVTVYADSVAERQRCGRGPRGQQERSRCRSGRLCVLVCVAVGGAVVAAIDGQGCYANCGLQSSESDAGGRSVCVPGAV